MMALEETRVCRECGTEFEAAFHRGTWPTHCPSCADVRQHRPSVVVERNLLAGPFLAVVESLPGEWQYFQAAKDDDPSYRIAIKGEAYGVAWHGRIDIFARHPFQPGDIVEISEIEAVHKVRATYTEIGTSPFTELDGGTASVTKRQTVHVRRPVGEEEIERRVYVRMDAPQEFGLDAETLPHLVFRVADSKTTLKGLGRQYRNDLRGAPLWERRIHGGCRSGRFWTDAALALVDGEHPLEVVNVFDR